MDINWLRDLIEVQAQGSFSKAASARHVSLSALSRRIQMLEAWAEHPLIDRSSYPVRLTLAGQDLLPVAQAVTGQIDQVRMRLRGVAAESKQIRFLAPNSVAVALFPRLLSLLQQVLGPLRVSVTPGNFNEVMQRFNHGEADFALYYLCRTFMPRETFSKTVSALVARDALLPVARSAKTARGSKADQWKVIMLDDTSYLGRVARAVMLHHDLNYEIGVTAPQILAIHQFAVEGAGLAWLPASLVEEDLARGRLTRVLTEIKPVAIETYVVRQSAPLELAHERVWESLQEYGHSRRIMDFTKRIA
ncbi:LysR family transcriptional regulator [Sulfuritalea hydrogenivorans]|uniref:Transcriptional regulator, LysR family n=1 Tax=Sulfuritalea hydrogenivorans sk43H TaxID=1223802 RepID=W0SC63_9PROT|nr:LysR family transcriptional regulator [Sulfuritalea hydrogenivorans]BAO28325.1 transcriptional regulator, LysR family [Sulfuritalea hydrogenivorans sk43H]